MDSHIFFFQAKGTYLVFRMKQTVYIVQRSAMIPLSRAVALTVLASYFLMISILSNQP